MTAYFPITLLASLLLSLDYAGAATYSYTTIAFPGAAATNPVSINGSGLVAGYFFDSGFGGHGFTYKAGIYTQVDAGGTCGSTFVTNGINETGEIAGDQIPVARGDAAAFVFQYGSYTSLAVPGSVISIGSGVNNQGVIVGSYTTGSIDLYTFGFIATPE